MRISHWILCVYNDHLHHLFRHQKRNYRIFNDGFFVWCGSTWNPVCAECMIIKDYLFDKNIYEHVNKR